MSDLPYITSQDISLFFVKFCSKNALYKSATRNASQSLSLSVPLIASSIIYLYQTHNMLIILTIINNVDNIILVILLRFVNQIENTTQSTFDRIHLSLASCVTRNKY